ncbi:MAG: hypothetical protein RML93_00295, partial [Anaerolineales bacterium]|nr:hypothetical protein [Anaerolineales bacterium]MDW8445709.1 hypothetical protein [Anaerolineales bacterium]
MRRSHPSAYFLIICLSLILQAFLGYGSRSAQTTTPEEQAYALLERLTPAERVGQLFLVSFRGSTVTEADPIYTLITQYKVGGVVLSAANDNFTQVENLPEQTQNLIRTLQLFNAQPSTQTLTSTASGLPGE